ncbi:serine/threonine protein kinase [Actinoplanes italicus]|uniref:non-specific serine/threonine protein kinase n=1 Tax=Actinoplanes italicus TaxID=113567 RepID=A0A2T0K477_9ACTN|nr:serine/threonine protein kinase [Actinoplanes italicus]
MLNGRYQLTQRIAAGGMGEVWRGDDLLLHREIAVKVLLPALMSDSDFITRFRSEARMMAALRHPGIVQVYDYGENAQVGAHRLDYLVMEYIDGTPLSKKIQQAGRLGAGETMTAVAQVADALHAAHEAGIVHRDVKPSNLLVRPAGAIVLVDFGVARSTGITGITSTNVVLGSAHYMAPEQAEGRPVTAATDVYALGAVAFSCLTGRPPYVGDNPLAVLAQLVHGQPPVLPPDVPPAVASVVLRALAKDPGRRFPSASGLAAAARGAASQPGLIASGGSPLSYGPASHGAALSPGSALPQGSAASTGSALSQAPGLSHGTGSAQGAALPHGSGSPQGPASPHGSGSPHGSAVPQWPTSTHGAAPSHGSGSSRGPASSHGPGHPHGSAASGAVPVSPARPGGAGPGSFAPGSAQVGGPSRGRYAAGSATSGFPAAGAAGAGYAGSAGTGSAGTGSAAGFAPAAAGPAGGDGAASARRRNMTVALAAAAVVALLAGVGIILGNRAGGSPPIVESQAGGLPADQPQAGGDGEKPRNRTSTRPGGQKPSPRSGNATVTTAPGEDGATAGPDTSGEPTATATTDPGGGPGGDPGSTTPVTNPHDDPVELCGAGYTVINSKKLTTSAGVLRGTIYLLHRASGGMNCVVTIKANTLDQKTAMAAALEVQDGVTKADKGSFQYYAGPVTAAAPSTCIRWGGTIGGLTFLSEWSHCT